MAGNDLAESGRGVAYRGEKTAAHDQAHFGARSDGGGKRNNTNPSRGGIGGLKHHAGMRVQGKKNEVGGKGEMCTPSQASSRRSASLIPQGLATFIEKQERTGSPLKDTQGEKRKGRSYLKGGVGPRDL